jgi:hypothetical protein
LAVCNADLFAESPKSDATRVKDPKTQLVGGAEVPNARMLAFYEAAAIKKLHQLAASDPKRIHATALSTHNRMGWKWRVYLPPGKDWKIKGAIGRIPGRGHQPQEGDIASQDIMRLDQSRIIALEGHISRDHFEDNWVLTVEADRRVFSGNEIAVWGLDEEVADYVIGKRDAASVTAGSMDIGRVRTKTNEELQLLMWRYEPKVDPPPPGDDRRLPGFVIWIEAN